MSNTKRDFRFIFISLSLHILGLAAISLLHSDEVIDSTVELSVFADESTSAKPVEKPAGRVSVVANQIQAVDATAVSNSEGAATVESTPDTLNGVAGESAANGDAIFSAGQLEKAPKLMGWQKPKYPESVRQKKQEGLVIAKLKITKTGAAELIEIISSPGEAFTQSAIEVIPTFKFTPAVKDGQAVSTSIVFKFNFKLEDE